MEGRLKALGEKKTDKVKRYRNEMKSARVAEQQERKQWTKKQQIIHSYGNQEEDLTAEPEEIVDSDSTVYSHIGGVHSMQGDGEGILIVMGHTTEEARGQVSTAQLSRSGRKWNYVSVAQDTQPGVLPWLPIKQTVLIYILPTVFCILVTIFAYHL